MTEQKIQNWFTKLWRSGKISLVFGLILFVAASRIMIFTFMAETPINQPDYGKYIPAMMLIVHIPLVLAFAFNVFMLTRVRQSSLIQLMLILVYYTYLLLCGPYYWK